jgi:hypothetical protein
MFNSISRIFARLNPSGNPASWFIATLGAICGCLTFAITPVAAEDASNPFGVIEGFWLPEAVCELGAGWERIIFDWAQHQPTGPEDWHTLNVDDRWLQAARDCDREVVAIIKHTPDWATEGLPGPGIPSGLYLPVDDPNNYWANFMRRAAAYYAPRGVSRFIIWNEPDIDPGVYGFEFEGSLEDYFQLLKVAYLALRQGNPDAEVLLAGTTYWHDINEGNRLYLDRLLERIFTDPEAVAHEYYFHKVSLHIYFRTETVYDIVRLTRGILDRYGLQDKAIWINEMNASPTDDPLWPVVRPQYQLDLDQQAAFLVHGAASGLAAGAERMAVYKFYDWNLPPGDETFGIIRADQSRRPAYDSWAMVIREMRTVEAGDLARNDQAEIVRLVRRDGSVLWVAWARTEASVALEITSVAMRGFFDHYGQPLQAEPSSGAYRIVLSGARCNPVDKCAVGGDPWLWVTGPDGDAKQISGGGTINFQWE